MSYTTSLLKRIPLFIFLTKYLVHCSFSKEDKLLRGPSIVSTNNFNFKIRVVLSNFVHESDLFDFVSIVNSLSIKSIELDAVVCDTVIPVLYCMVENCLSDDNDICNMLYKL